MTPESAELVATFIAAFPDFVRNRIIDRGLPPVDDAVDEATRWLDDHLQSLFALPATEQVQSPLQVVRDAVRIPSQALERHGVPPVDRDDMEAELLPADPYWLAPASSRDLGEEAFRAHLAWGIAKAKEVADVVPGAGAPSRVSGAPTVVLVTTNLMDRTKITSVVQGAGFSASVLRNPGAVAEHIGANRPWLAYVDLEHGGADEAIRLLAAAGVKVIAYGPHVDDVALTRARTLGAVEAVPRSRFFRDPGAYLPVVA